MGWLKDFFSTEEEQSKSKRKNKKIDSLLDKDLDDEEIMEDLEDNEKKWIQIEITVMTPYSELINLKKTLKPYAEELNWEIESGNRTVIEDNTGIGGSKIKRVNITLRPKNRFISPIDFLNNREKIIGFVFSIHRDLLHGGNHEEAIKDFGKTINITSTIREGHKANKNDYTINESISFLNYDYKLNDRIKFEKRNNKAALELFKKTSEEDIKYIFQPQNKPEKRIDKKLSKKDKEILKQFENFEEDNGEFKKEISELFGWKL